MKSTSRGEREYIKVIEPQTETDWGEWGEIEFCPGKSFAVGFKLKVQKFQGETKEMANNGCCGYGEYDYRYLEDDTGLNGIQLHCKDYNSDRQSSSYHIQSSTGPWGEWSDEINCKDESGGGGFGKKVYLNGAQLKYTPFLGDIDVSTDDYGNKYCYCLQIYFPLYCYSCKLKDGFKDDTAANNLFMTCTEGEPLEVTVHKDVQEMGQWSKMELCPDGTAICGIQTRVFDDYGEDGVNYWEDDTALNGVKFYCCAIHG